MKNYIFDLGGVLINLNPTGVQEKWGMPEYQLGNMSTEAFVDAVLERIPESGSRAEVIDTWNACLGELPKERLDLILQLRAQGHRTYLLSNTNELHWQYIVKNCLSAPGYSVPDLFDDVFLSQEMHLAKPDLEIYRQVLASIGAKPEECVFIDDSKENIEAARSLGIDARWLDLSKHFPTICLENVRKWSNYLLGNYLFLIFVSDK